MAVFSDLPNELIMHVWSYVIEPESVENFALVSKRVYGLATPFVKEHARLEQKYSRIIYSNRHWRVADLLETMLLNPRVALYIKELRIKSWASCWKQQYKSPPKPYPSGTMKVLKEAVLSSPLIPPHENRRWIEEIKKGDEDPIIALMIMQITNVTKFELSQYSWETWGTNYFTVKTLGRITQSSEVAIPEGSSTIKGEMDCGKEVDYSQFSSFSNVSDFDLCYSDINKSQLSRLLQGIRELKSFSFLGDEECTVEPVQIRDVLLATSQHSLQKLCLQFEFDIDDPEASSVGDLARFESLIALDIDFVLLLGRMDTTCLRLADVLPVSIESVTLFSTTRFPAETLKEVIFQMVQSKTERLPNLKALTFNPLQDGACSNVGLVADLIRMSADVGVLLKMFKSA